MPIYKMEGKKDGLQKYRVRINYIDANTGKAKQLDRVAYGKEAAKLLELQLKQQTTDKSGALKANMTIKQLFDEYITVKKSEIRQTTLRQTIATISHYVLPTMQNIKIKNINAAVCQNWKSGINELDLATRTKQRLFGEFRTMLNYAVKMEYIPKNYLTIVGNFKNQIEPKPSDKIRYYTSEQFLKYKAVALNQAENSNGISEWCYYVFFCIAYYTGMRKGEINALKWEDIDGNIIHVRHSVTQKVNGISAIETPPKSKSSYRDLQAPQQLVDTLHAHYQRQRETFPNFSENFKVCGADKYLPDTSISNHNRKYAQLAKLPRITIHEFRHSHASLLANEGINIQEIARRLGHSKIEITWNTYSHLYPREEERAIKILEKIV